MENLTVNILGTEYKIYISGMKKTTIYLIEKAEMDTRICPRTKL